LVVKSMVQLEPRTQGGARYRLLEPLRQFGFAELVASGELDAARRAHAAWVAAFCEGIHRDAHLDGHFERWRELHDESDNIRAALEYALAEPDVELALRIGASLWLYWTRPDLQTAAREWLERILALPTLALPTVDAARLASLRLSATVGLADV